MNPAISVHNSTWNALGHAINWRSDVLVQSCEQRAHNQDGEGDSVVEPEGRVVDEVGTSAFLEAARETSKDAIHFDFFKILSCLIGGNQPGNLKKKILDLLLGQFCTSAL